MDLGNYRPTFGDQEAETQCIVADDTFVRNAGHARSARLVLISKKLDKIKQSNIIFIF